LRVVGIPKPEIRERLLIAAVAPVGDTPEEFRTFLKADFERWAEAANASDVKKAKAAGRGEVSR